MKKVFSIFFIIIIFVSIWSEFPVDLKGLEYISDVFWSSRGTDGWHEGD